MPQQGRFGGNIMRALTAFIINSVLLGVGLAMDAFSVSMANGLNAPRMSRGMKLAIPLTLRFSSS